MSAPMESIYMLMDTCFEEFTLDEKACVLETYLEMYEQEMCALCCDDLQDGKCPTPECEGATREQNIDHAKDAMFDNMHDAGFDDTALWPLIEALTLLMQVRYQSEPGGGLKAHLNALTASAPRTIVALPSNEPNSGGAK